MNLVSYSSTITMMHIPIYITITYTLSENFNACRL